MSRKKHAAVYMIIQVPQLEFNNNNTHRITEQIRAIDILYYPNDTCTTNFLFKTLIYTTYTSDEALLRNRSADIHSKIPATYAWA